MSRYKQNWDATRQRFAQWWQRQPMERPLLVVTAPKGSEDGEESSSGTSCEQQWLNQTAVLDRAEQRFANTYYVGEAYPSLWANLGPGSLGTFLGATPRFYPDTVWYEPCFPRIEQAELALEKEGQWWVWSLEATAEAVARAQDEYLVSIPDLVENLDTLAALVGTEEVLMHLVDQPAEVHRLQNQLVPLWLAAYDAHYDIVRDANGWSSFAAFSIWGPGKTAKLQCDIAAMLSKGMFDEFVLPYLRTQCEQLDSTIFHLDGQGAIHHLSSLLTIDALDCIQWTPGAGAADGGDPCWDQIYARTLDAGKAIHAHMPIEQVRPFVKRFGATGVFIATQAANEQEAQALLKDVTR